VSAPRAVLFDMDGVLVRSEESWFRVVEEAGRRFRGRAITREEFAPTFGQGTAADVAGFGLNCSVAELDRFYIEAFPRFAGEMWINPDAKPVITALRQSGKKVAVVTNSVTPLAHEVLDAASLRELFEVVACADQVAHAKPAPDLVLHACRQLGVSPSEAWMVGDSRFDRGAAEAAGAFFVGLGIDGNIRLEALAELLRHLDC
jgi:phosphoglycolate phosphatase/AHBA synthesis associated protein